MVSSPKSVLITGCSNGGIGSALALELQKRGYIVFATVRTPSKASNLADLPNTHIITLDVTDSASIAVAVEAVVEKTSGRGLDILINNAGHGLLGPMTEIPLDQARKLFDVNFFGVLAITQAFTPQLVRTHGLIVNIASVGALMFTPWMGIYSASKAALYAASANMRMELKPLGVRVQCVVAGLVKSEFDSNVPEIQLDKDSMYADALKEIESLRTGALRKNNNMSIKEFAKRVANDIGKQKSGNTYRGGLASTAVWLNWLLPSSLIVSLFLSLL